MALIKMLPPTTRPLQESGDFLQDLGEALAFEDRVGKLGVQGF